MTAFHVRQISAHPAQDTFGHARTYGPDHQLTVAVRPFRDGAVLIVSGELDLAVAAGLDADVDAAIARGLVRLVLDLSALDFCDCSGLAALLRARTKAADRNGWVRLTHVQPRLARVIRIAGLGAAFSCFPGVDGAFDGTQLPAPAAARTRQDEAGRGQAPTRTQSPRRRPAWPAPQGIPHEG